MSVRQPKEIQEMLFEKKTRNFHGGNSMKLSVKGMAVACSLLWGGAIFVGGICHRIWPSYGGALLDFAASIYPGYHPGGLISVVVGTLYALIDGGVGGALLAWLYNLSA